MLLGYSVTMSVMHVVALSPGWLIRSGCGSRLRGTGFESRPVQIFVIESMVLCTTKNPWSHSISVGHSLLLSRSCNGCAESDIKKYSLAITRITLSPVEMSCYLQDRPVSSVFACIINRCYIYRLTLSEVRAKPFCQDHRVSSGVHFLIARIMII